MMDKKINFVFKNTNHATPLQFDTDILDYRTTHGKEISTLYNVLASLDLVRSYYENNLPEEIFFFEYEWHWWFKIEDFFGDNGILQSNPCPENVLRRIKDKTAYLVITIAMESLVFTHHLNIIHSYIEKMNIPYSQILYFNCSPNGNQLYEYFCKLYNTTPKFISKYVPFYLNVYRHFYMGSDNRSYTPEHKSKDFLMFNRRWGNHPQRVLFLYFFYKMNLIDKMFISFSKTEIDNGGSYTEHFKRFEDRLENFHGDENLLEVIEKNLPLLLDVDNLSVDLMYNSTDTTLGFYENSFINIVAETYFFADVIHITEKTFKPIVFLQPFIMLSVPYFLKHLRDLGFKTFGEIWDESYDNEENHTKRFFKILQLMKTLSELSDKEKIEIANQCKPIIEHNAFHLSQLKTNKIITELIEEYGTC